MKAEKLIIKNIGLIAEESIELNKPLILFYGEIRQGKTTILNAVRWVCGGPFPTDIIRNGQHEAFIEFRFTGGYIRREFYVAKDGTTKARKIEYVKAGRPQDDPVAKIKQFLNPFLLDQDHLRNMSEMERKKFFVELFAVDTSQDDVDAIECEHAASELRAKIKGYGDIDLTEVKSIDINGLRKELAQKKDVYAKAISALDIRNDAAAKANRQIDEESRRLGNLNREISETNQKLKTLMSEAKNVDEWLRGQSKSEINPRPPIPDTSDIEAKISEAAANQVRVQQYEQNKARDAERKSDSAKLQSVETQLREIRAKKIAKLKEISDSCAIGDLSFGENGDFVYQGTRSGMLSTSQIMRLSSELSAMYPEGFGIELLDRGESLGRSIFDYVKLAEEKQVTVLATIVGSKPADIPDTVGVFVVQDGHLLS